MGRPIRLVRGKNSLEFLLPWQFRQIAHGHFLIFQIFHSPNILDTTIHPTARATLVHIEPDLQTAIMENMPAARNLSILVYEIKINLTNETNGIAVLITMSVKGFVRKD
jgi:hypothetical protein